MKIIIITYFLLHLSSSSPIHIHEQTHTHTQLDKCNLPNNSRLAISVPHRARREFLHWIYSYNISSIYWPGPRCHWSGHIRLYSIVQIWQQLSTCREYSHLSASHHHLPSNTTLEILKPIKLNKRLNLIIIFAMPDCSTQDWLPSFCQCSYWCFLDHYRPDIKWVLQTVICPILHVDICWILNNIW